MTDLRAARPNPVTPARVTSCPVCGSSDLRPFTDPVRVPTLSCRLWPDPESAKNCPRGDIALALCASCGLVLNRLFDPTSLDYDEHYENSLHFSGLFREYAEWLADDLIRTHRLRDKLVVEVGCGKGDFLRMLAVRGGNRAVGIDPGYEPDPSAPPIDGVAFVKQPFGDVVLADRADLVVARQVLEHVDDPRVFLARVRDLLASEGAAVIEVPNADDMLERADVWDVIYEHPVYYTAHSLRHLMVSAGFDMLAMRPVYGGLYLLAEGLRRETPTSSEDLHAGSELVEAVERFSAAYWNRVLRWQKFLADVRTDGRLVALWGAGARGDTFLNVLDAREEIPLVVDVNPRKWGRFIAGTGQQIQSPEVLGEYPVDTVVIANEIYRDEIGAQLRSLGVDADVEVA